MTDTLKDRSQTARDYARIEAAIRYLQSHYRDQPGLDEIAAAVHVSPYHFQRLFTRWAGISPKRFLQCLTIEHAKTMLVASESLLDTALEIGLSGPGRLHDLFMTFEAITPGEFKEEGRGLTLRWGIAEGPYGFAGIALNDRGICALEFLATAAPESALERLARRLPQARFNEAPDDIAKISGRLFNRESGATQSPLTLCVRGTNFQIRVWRALLNIPPGRLATYGAIAGAVGRPSAARAVGSAIGANPIGYLIPCHRVIRSTGLMDTNYRWGAPRKLAMIGSELAGAAKNKSGQAAQSL
ncbi:MAG: methylated-DNA--[protein]-cysteine S-methyltransferase [Proteobacteria bacterium]|nr:methylated-DNA--[protein]-cysteine S-methyltransferase [Pseudomonadota bacterium]MDA1326612.1 methylated-DNA--[protein]-cysteine S-methyltransferase [Pseudomonadota bacterium]